MNEFPLFPLEREATPAHVPFARGQMDYGAYVGAWRRVESVRRGYLQAHRQDAPFEVLISNDILGARGELAAKTWLEPIGWNAFALPRQPDGSRTPDLFKGDLKIDVKAIRKAHHCLIVQEDAADDWAHLLVDASARPDFWIKGWLWGHEAKLKRFWNDEGFGPAFYVRALRDPAELLAEVRRRDGEP